VNENYHHYRHSLDSRFVLWRNGPNDLCVYDCERLMNDETFKDFWKYKGRETLPTAAVANREVYKVLGLSRLDPSTQVLHYLEKDKDYKNVKTEYTVKEVFPSRKSWLDVSEGGDDDGGVSGRKHRIHRWQGRGLC